MAKYRKKPVVIEAWQLTKDSIAEVYEIVYGVKVDENDATWQYDKNRMLEQGMTIPTLEDGDDKRAMHVASIGDYIIKGTQGELYPCKPDIFNEIYSIEEENVLLL